MPIPTRKLAGLRRIALAAALASAPVVWAATKGPDAAQYTGTDVTVYSFIDIAGAGGSASVLADTDDGATLLAIPFPFKFYGQTYTAVCASVNGLLTFVANAACGAAVDFANTDLTATAPPGDPPAILPFWTDLTFQVPGGGAVFYQAQGTPGSRKFIVQWNNAYPQGSANPVTLQAVLIEGANQILFQYRTVDLGQGNPASNGAMATIGIRDAGGNTNGRQIAWSYDAAVLANGTAILFSPPATAQASVNTITSIPAGLTVSIDGAAYTTPKTVSWTPGTPHTLSVTTPQTAAGIQQTFTSWSTGSGPSISVTAATPGTTYTATFSTQYQLTTGVSPVNAGTVTGAGWYSPGALVSVQANAAANYVFSTFSGDASGSTNPVSVTMSAPKNVVANFRSTAAPKLVATIPSKSGADLANRVWTVQLANQGLGLASAAQITGLTLTQVMGTPCSPAPVVTSSLPVVVGDIAAGANARAQVSLSFAGCQGTVRFTVVVAFSANSGSYTGSTTLSNQVD